MLFRSVKSVFFFIIIMVGSKYIDKKKDLFTSSKSVRHIIGFSFSRFSLSPRDIYPKDQKYVLLRHVMLFSL